MARNNPIKSKLLCKIKQFCFSNKICLTKYLRALYMLQHACNSKCPIFRLESYNAVKHEFAKVDFLIKSTHYLTKHQFSFPDDNSQIFNQFMLGGGQKAEEGSKQSNLCHFIPKIFALQFSPAINILLVAQITVKSQETTI